MVKQAVDSAHARILEAAQIEHIRVFLESDDPDLGLLRSFATNWFAYKHGGPFLKKSGRPRWLNKFDPVKRADLLRACHYRSHRADRMIGRSGKKGDLVVDHAIPFSCLREMLQREKHTNDNIEQCLSQYLRLAVITQDENQKLNKMKLRSQMPDGSMDPLARYAKAGIGMSVSGCL